MPYLVQSVPHALQIAVGRDEDAVGAGHGLENERGDRVRTLELDHFLERRERRPRSVPSALDAVVRVQDVDDAGNAGLVGPPPRVARSATCSRPWRRDTSGSARGSCDGR